MPVYSMTGYASAQRSLGASGAEADSRPSAHAQLGLEIRSVNSRFLDMTFRLPEELRAFEPALRDILNARLKRGKVEVRASVESQSNGTVADPSARLMQRLNSVQDSVRAWLPQATPLSVADVLRIAAAEQPGERDWSADLLALAQQAVQDLMDARAREGARLTAMLNERLTQLRALADQAEPMVPRLVEQQRQRFLERWKEAMGMAEGGVSVEAAHNRALEEATAFAIRIDVAEEVSRLRSHLDEISSLLKKGGEVGKRLDFLIQELHREANTLGSKSSALELTRVSVDMKVLIEQMREQVQNLE